MRKKNVKEEPVQYSKRDLRLSKLKNERINPVYLSDLLMDHKLKRAVDPNYKMSDEMGDVLLVMIEKTIGSSGWRGYSPDWKEEFRGRAIDHLVRYSHGFNPEKCKNGKGDAGNYLIKIIVSAFIQSLNKCKAYSENNIHINHDIIYDESMWNQDNEMKIEAEERTKERNA